MTAHSSGITTLTKLSACWMAKMAVRSTPGKLATSLPVTESRSATGTALTSTAFTTQIVRTPRLVFTMRHDAHCPPACSAGTYVLITARCHQTPGVPVLWVNGDIHSTFVLQRQESVLAVTAACGIAMSVFVLRRMRGQQTFCFDKDDDKHERSEEDIQWILIVIVGCMWVSSGIGKYPQHGLSRIRF
jgi:hypothetical protein